MQVNEADFWNDRIRPLLVRECRAGGHRAHLERIENTAGVGTPDVDYCIDSVAGKVELKFAPRHPIRNTSRILAKGKGLRRSQIVWAVRRMRAGGRVFLLIGTPEQAWLINLAGMSAREMADLETITPSRAAEISAWCACHWRGPTLPLALIAERPVTPRGR